MITASFKTHFGEENNVPVLNPGGWFGQCWLVEHQLGNGSSFFVVEADTYHDAQDEFSDDETYRHLIHVDDADLGDYPEDEREYDGSGRVIDTTWLMIHGPFNPNTTQIKYYGDNIPLNGVSPSNYMDDFVYDQHDDD